MEGFLTLMNGKNKTWRDYKSSRGLIRIGVWGAKMLGLEKRNFR
jgi:hypothetical protein